MIDTRWLVNSTHLLIPTDTKQLFLFCVYKFIARQSVYTCVPMASIEQCWHTVELMCTIVDTNNIRVLIYTWVNVSNERWPIQRFQWTVANSTFPMNGDQFNVSNERWPIQCFQWTVANSMFPMNGGQFHHKKFLGTISTMP